MKRIPVAVALVAAGLLIASAAGIAGEDHIGVFADPDGSLAGLQVERLAPFDLYIVLLDPSTSTGIYGWECRLEHTTNVEILDATVVGQGLNVLTPPDFVVGLGTPLSAQSDVVLARIRCRTTDERSASVWLVPTVPSSVIPPSPAYVAGDPGSPDGRTLKPLTTAGRHNTLLVNGLTQNQIGSTRLAISATGTGPTAPGITIRYETTGTHHVHLQIFNVRGHLVRTLVDRPVAQGRHEIQWDGRDESGRSLPSGVYLARLETEKEVVHGRMTLVK